MFHRPIPAIAEYQWVRDRIRTEFPDIDEDTLADTAEGMTTLPDLLGAVIRAHLEDVDHAAALRRRIETMTERARRLEQRAERKKHLACSAMEQASLSKLVQPDFTVTLRPIPPALVVTAEEKIPTEYWKPQPPKLDRLALAAALRAGVIVSGAKLGNGSVTLAVRTK